MDNVSLAMIVEGRGCHANSMRRVPFGSYVLANMDTTKNMNTRAVHAITINRSNDFGGYYFYSLETGKRIHSAQ